MRLLGVRRGRGKGRKYKKLSLFCLQLYLLLPSLQVSNIFFPESQQNHASHTSLSHPFAFACLRVIITSEATTKGGEKIWESTIPRFLI